MPVTIRNQTIERQIREIGAETGEGPSALIRRLVADEKDRLTEVQRFELARRRHVMRELLAMLPPLTGESRTDMDRIMDEMYDQDGLPQ